MLGELNQTVMSLVFQCGCEIIGKLVVPGGSLAGPFFARKSFFIPGRSTSIELRPYLISMLSSRQFDIDIL